jgi:hypothetical protein
VVRDEADAPLLGQPARLTHEAYFSPRSSLCVYHQFAHVPVAVHWHEFYEMHLILAGEGTHVLSGAAHSLARGTLFLLTPADFHALRSLCGAPLEIFNVIFSEEALSEEVQRLLFAEPAEYRLALAGSALDGVEAECRRLWSEAQERQVGHRMVMEGALERILIDVARLVGAGEAATDRRPASPRRNDGLVVVLT